MSTSYLAQVNPTDLHLILFKYLSLKKTKGCLLKLTAWHETEKENLTHVENRTASSTSFWTPPSSPGKAGTLLLLLLHYYRQDETPSFKSVKKKKRQNAINWTRYNVLTRTCFHGCEEAAGSMDVFSPLPSFCERSEYEVKKSSRRKKKAETRRKYLPGSLEQLVLFRSAACGSVACFTNVTVTVHQPGFACCTLHTGAIVCYQCVCVCMRVCTESWEGAQWLSHIQPLLKTVWHHLGLFISATIGPMIISFSTIKELIT